jgi:hypothetical protein
MQPKSEINTIIVVAWRLHHKFYYYFWGMLNISKLTFSTRKRFDEGK